MWQSGGRRLLVALCAVLVVLAFCSVPRPAAGADTAQLVLVLDSSGSMKAKVGGETKISIAKAALNTVVRKLPPDAAVGLRVYGAKVFDKSEPGACTDSQLVVPIGTGNRAALETQIARYKPYGETPISYSLQQAAKDLGGSGKRTILLVSDGEETCAADPCATAAAITKNHIDVKIDVVGLAVAGTVRSQLQCVARRGNGTYYDARSKTDLEDSLDKLSTRAFRPFRLTGTPIEGSRKKSDAPLAGPGQYVDKFAVRDDPLYYRIPRTTPDSTLHVGFTARPAGMVPTAFLRLYDPSGAECGTGLAQAIAIGGTAPLVTTEAQSWRSSRKSPCNTADELVAEVRASGGDLAGAPFELLVAEEPPVTDDRDLPPVDTSLRWTKVAAGSPTKPPVPGSSLSDAPVLGSGTYRTTILTGETQVFAVPLDWGQRLQVDVQVPKRTGALARVLDVSDALDLQLLGAMRGRYSNLTVRGQPRDSITMADDSSTFRVTGATPTIAYANRGRVDAYATASIPGPQYVVLNMTEDNDGYFLVPYTVTVAVLGTAGEGRPEYAGVATPTPTPTPEPASATPFASATPGPTTGGGSDGVALPVVFGIAGGAVGLGVVLALGAGVLRRRRHRDRSQS